MKMIANCIGLHEVLQPIIYKNYDFQEEKNSQVIERGNLHQKTDKGDVNCLNVTKVVIGCFNLNYNFE